MVNLLFRESDQVRPRRPLKKSGKNEVTEKKGIASLGGIRTLNACVSGPNRYTNWATDEVVILEGPIHTIYVLGIIFRGCPWPHLVTFGKNRFSNQ